MKKVPMVNARFLASAELKKVKKAVATYAAARGVLKDLGVIQSNREVQGELAEWFAARLLGLDRAQAFQRGFDATDANDRKYEIKSQTVENLDASASFEFRRSFARFHWFVGVLMARDLSPLAVIRISSSELKARASEGSRGSRFQWTSNYFNEPWVETIWRSDR